MVIFEWLTRTDCPAAMARGPVVCSSWRRALTDENLFRSVCEEFGVTRVGSKRRGKGWRDSFASRLCLSCVRPGQYVIDANGGKHTSTSVLVCSCGPCVDNGAFALTCERVRRRAPKHPALRAASVSADPVLIILMESFPAFRCPVTGLKTAVFSSGSSSSSSSRAGKRLSVPAAVSTEAM
jgi:hypothetical protein